MQPDEVENNAIETLCAFVHATGGTMFFGVTVQRAGDDQLFYAFNKPYLRAGKRRAEIAREKYRRELRNPKQMKLEL